MILTLLTILEERIFYAIPTKFTGFLHEKIMIFSTSLKEYLLPAWNGLMSSLHMTKLLNISWMYSQNESHSPLPASSVYVICTLYNALFTYMCFKKYMYINYKTLFEKTLLSSLPPSPSHTDIFTTLPPPYSFWLTGLGWSLPSVVCLESSNRLDREETIVIFIVN